MTIFEQIKDDLKNAMKSGDKESTQTLRLIFSDMKTEAVNAGSDRENIADDVALKVLDKAVKNRKESIRIYTETNRNDLAEAEQSEMKILEKYLPAQLSDEELKEIVQKVKDENPSVQGMALMGKVMPFVKGKADPDRIKNLL
jgi:uncharacterized protein